MSLESCNCLCTRSSSNRRNWSRYGKNGQDPLVCGNEIVARLKIPRWRAFWRKMKREKKRFLSCSAAVHVHVPFGYDPISYSQNFDDGCSTDSQNVFSSFLARFAVPSSILENNQEVG